MEGGGDEFQNRVKKTMICAEVNSQTPVALMAEYSIYSHHAKKIGADVWFYGLCFGSC